MLTHRVHVIFMIYFYLIQINVLTQYINNDDYNNNSEIYTDNDNVEYYFEPQQQDRQSQQPQHMQFGQQKFIITTYYQQPTAARDTLDASLAPIQYQQNRRSMLAQFQQSAAAQNAANNMELRISQNAADAQPNKANTGNVQESRTQNPQPVGQFSISRPVYQTQWLKSGTNQPEQQSAESNSQPQPQIPSEFFQPLATGQQQNSFSDTKWQQIGIKPTTYIIYKSEGMEQQANGGQLPAQTYDFKYETPQDNAKVTMSPPRLIIAQVQQHTTPSTTLQNTQMPPAAVHQKRTPITVLPHNGPNKQQQQQQLFYVTPQQQLTFYEQQPQQPLIANQQQQQRQQQFAVRDKFPNANAATNQLTYTMPATVAQHQRLPNKNNNKNRKGILQTLVHNFTEPMADPTQLATCEMCCNPLETPCRMCCDTRPLLSAALLKSSTG